MIAHRIWIHCDIDGCPGFIDTRRSDAESARKFASRAGWINCRLADATPGGRVTGDLCPEHAEKRKAGPGKRRE